MGTDPSDSRSDLYSTAAVLYWLITGEAPLVREMREMAIPTSSIGRQRAERRQLVPEQVDGYDERIPAELAQLVAHWLHRDPDERGAGDDRWAACPDRAHAARPAEESAVPQRAQRHRDRTAVGTSHRPGPPSGPTGTAPDEGNTPYE